MSAPQKDGTMDKKILGGLVLDDKLKKELVNLDNTINKLKSLGDKYKEQNLTITRSQINSLIFYRDLLANVVSEFIKK